MNTQAMPAVRRSWLAEAAEVLRSWTAWRSRRPARARLDVVSDGLILGFMVACWAVAFCFVCPPTPMAHHRPAVTHVVLR